MKLAISTLALSVCLAAAGCNDSVTDERVDDDDAVNEIE